MSSEPPTNPPRWRGLRTLALTLGLLGLVGWALRPVERAAWVEIQAAQPTLRPGGIGTLGAQGLATALLGGFRAVAADLLFLHAYSRWVASDADEMEGLLRLVSELEPQTHDFWLFTARVLAADVPVWRARAQAAQGGAPLDDAQRAALRAEQGQRALRLLERARDYYPREPGFLIEQARVAFFNLDNPRLAAAYYARAAALPGAPPTAHLGTAECLVRAGQPEHAAAYLRTHLAAIPPGPWRERAATRLRELTQAAPPAGQPAARP